MAEAAKNDMPGMYPWRELLELERFGEAWQLVRTAVAECEAKGVSNEAVMAALFSELLPRMVGQYGPTHVAAVFGRMANSAVLAVQSSKHVQ